MRRWQPLVLLTLAWLWLGTASSAELGSVDFLPTPERPIGWRGDGSGQFPGATPPLTWERRVNGISSQIMVQAAKPKGAPGKESNGLAYFTLKDWLVAGPFPADPAKDIETDFINGEATVEPDAGMKAGTAVWKLHRACEATQAYHEYNTGTCSNMYVDFVFALGKQIPPEKPYAKGYGSPVYASLDKQAAYAHTYLFSPQATDMDLDILHNLAAVKLWINGVPQAVGVFKPSEHKPLKIHLNEGWNRLLVKTVCESAVDGRFSKWKFAAHLTPAGSNLNSPGARGAMTYRTKNISWMIKLTGRCMSQPIVIGDKIFLGSGNSDFFCIDKNSGKILWLHTVSYWDAMTPEQRTAIKDKADPVLAAVEKANAEIVALLNAGISPQGLDPVEQKKIDTKLAEREKVVKELHNAIAEKTIGKIYQNEVSAGNATPASDGNLVYWFVQGNGGFLSCAFDLNGKLIWGNIVRKSDAGEHGSHRSPVLCENKLLVATNDQLIGYDAPTGKELWRVPGASHQHGVDGSPIVVTLNGKHVIQTSKSMVSLNGEVLSEGGYQGWGAYVPIVEDGMLYNSCHAGDWPFEAIQLQPGVKPKIAWSLDAKALRGPIGDAPFFVASPLYVGGLLYQVDGHGHFDLIDINQKKVALSRWMDGYNWHHRTLYGYCVSPSYAGNNLYFVDGAGYATVLKPGPEGTILANNIMENSTTLPGSGPCRQEVFNAPMYFSGKKMFLHGDEYLYCIEEK